MFAAVITFLCAGGVFTGVVLRKESPKLACVLMIFGGAGVFGGIGHFLR